jgi:hypothetical protein
MGIAQISGTNAFAYNCEKGILRCPPILRTLDIKREALKSKDNRHTREDGLFLDDFQGRK